LIKLVSIGKAANMLGVCEETLRQWDRDGKLIAAKTAGNHRRYKMEDINRLCGKEEDDKAKEIKNLVAVYCRVSSHDQKQKGDLQSNLKMVEAGKKAAKTRKRRAAAAKAVATRKANKEKEKRRNAALKAWETRRNKDE